ncbi:hypothetical protein Patl1_37040 [Pistacia atlantica]|nr:hypothetical protein Patl1_37040 [Pistacia atlantica]
MSLELACVATLSKLTIRYHSFCLILRNCPSLRWMKITSMLSIVQLLVLMG